MLFFLILVFIVFIVFFKNNKIEESNKYKYHDNNFNEIKYNEVSYDSINNIYTCGHMSPTESPKNY